MRVGGRQQRAKLSGPRNPRQSLGGDQAVTVPWKRQPRSLEQVRPPKLFLWPAVSENLNKPNS